MSLTNEDYLAFDKQAEKIARGEVKVKNIHFEDNLLIIDINKNNIREKYDVYLVNNQARDYHKIHFSYDKEKIEIDMENLPILNKNLEGRWFFCIKSQYQEYILFEDLTLENNLGNAKIIKDIQSFYIDNERISTGIYLNDNGSLIYCQLPSLNYKKTTREIFNEKINIRNLSFSNTYCQFEIDRLEISKAKNIEIILTSRKTKERITFITKREHNELKCIFEEKILNDLPNGRWDISAEILSKDIFIQGRLRLEELDPDIKEIKYIELKNEEAILLYQTVNGNISIVKGKSYNVFREKNQVSLKLTKLTKVSGNAYNFKITLKSPHPLKILKTSLKLRNIERNKTIDIIDINIKSKSKNKYEVSGILNVQWDDFALLYWDFVVMVCDHTNHKGYLRANTASKRLLLKLDNDYFKNAIYTENKIIYPYITLDTSVAFVMREKEDYETVKNVFKKTVAYYVYKILKRVYFDKQNIWLGFEKFSKTAQDNGYAFFSYVDKNKLHKSYYYIIDKNSPDYERIKRDSSNIIAFMSFKYMVYIFASELLVSSETKRHAYNIRIRTDRIAHSLNEKRSVFLQHGVTGLKKSDVFRKAKGRGNFDLVVATSDVEKEIIKDNWNYSDEEVVVTGFSRWDLLKDKSFNVKKKKIFVMPTWRSWIEGLPKEDFVNTEYYLNYVSLLTSDKLKKILSENNLEMVFFLHPKFKEYISEFKIDDENIKIKGFLDIKVNEEIMESSLLISDYSSVTWDMFYLNKPVVFFQFDYERYDKYEGSYLNMSSELFGDRVLNMKELLNTIKQYIENDFTVKPQFRDLQNKYFKYNDQGNSERIFEEINNKLYKKGEV